MPENKEELYGILYEFDDHVRSMHEMLDNALDKECLYDDQERNYLIIYKCILEALINSYDCIDRHVAKQMQNGES